jgi:hypothetical protein
MPRCEPNSSQKRQISHLERSACPSTTEGVPVRFSFHPLWGASETGLHSRVLFPDGAGGGARERERDVRGGNRRNGKGSSSPQGAGSREFRQRGSGQPGLAVDMSAGHPASEPPRARPPKQATVNSRAHVSVWIQAARTALGLERPTPSRLMHDSFRSRDERDRKIVRSFYPASCWTSHPE